MSLDAFEEFLLDRGTEPVWELYHENSKLSALEPHLYFGRHPSDATVLAAMDRLRTVKPYADCRRVPLPPACSSPDMPLGTALARRRTARSFGTEPITLEQLASTLRHACGVTRTNEGTEYTRAFRAAPSGGALYPLELYVEVRDVEGLEPGSYHYDPQAHSLAVLRSGAERVSAHLVQQDLGTRCSALILLSATFLRSTFKYGDRGYRFALIEAGHLAQNVLLVATALGLAAAPIGGYLDGKVDQAMGFDGIDESVIYIVLVGSES